MCLKLVLSCSQFRQTDLVSEGDADDPKRVVILFEVFLKVVDGFVCEVCLRLFVLFHLLCKIIYILIYMMVS